MHKIISYLLKLENCEICFHIVENESKVERLNINMRQKKKVSRKMSFEKWNVISLRKVREY